MDEFKIQSADDKGNNFFPSRTDDSGADDQKKIPEMDLWAGDLGGGNEFTLGSAPKPSFVEGKGGFSGKKKIIFIITALLALGAAGYLLTTEDFSMDENLAEESEIDEVVKQTPPAPVETKTADSNVTPKSDIILNDQGHPVNPYWNLPNEIVIKEVQLNGVWTAEEEQSWKEAISHKFTYQRYKAVVEVKNAKLSGSEAILWEGLDQPKLWTRMRAAMGLADFGIPISFEVAEKAVGDARLDRVFRFVKRFEKKSTYGDRFVLRQIIRLLDGRGRLAVLRALKQHPNELRDLYFVAATYDPDPKVKQWLRKEMPAMTKEEMENYKEIVLGKREYVYKYSPTTEPASKEGLESVNVDGVVIYDITDENIPAKGENIN